MTRASRARRLPRPELPGRRPPTADLLVPEVHLRGCDEAPDALVAARHLGLRSQFLGLVEPRAILFAATCHG